MRCDPVLKLLSILSVSAMAMIAPSLLAEDASAGTDLMDSSYDMKGYIRQTGQLGGISNTSNNLIATVPIEPDTSYDVSISADNRFRVGTLNSSDLKTDFFLTDYYVSPNDDNGTAFIGDESCTLVSGSDHDLMAIFYWTGTSSQPSGTIRDSISVVRTAVSISGDAEEGVLVGTEWSFSPVLSDDTVVSVSGADWLSVSGNTVSGIPDAIGSYRIVLKAERPGYSDSERELPVTAVNILVFVSTCADGEYHG